MWWMYFDRPVHDLLTSLRKAFVWGYGHYFVFAAAAAVGAGLAVNVDYVAHHAKISGRPPARRWRSRWRCISSACGSCTTGPDTPHAGVRSDRRRAVVLATPFAPQPVLVTGVLLAATIAVKLIDQGLGRTSRGGACRA